MPLILRVILAVVCGVLTFLILTWLLFATGPIDALLGALVGLLVFFGGPALTRL